MVVGLIGEIPEFQATSPDPEFWDVLQMPGNGFGWCNGILEVFQVGLI